MRDCLEQPHQHGGKLNEREEVLCELLEAHRDASEALDTLEKVFDEAALAVEVLVVRALARAGRVRRDDHRAPLPRELVRECLRIVGAVANDVRITNVHQHRRCKLHLMGLAGRELKADRIAKCVHDRVDLRRWASARVTDLLGPPFFRAPDASWCARTMVASISKLSPSRSRESVAKTEAMTPNADQRDHRVYTDCQGPYAGGRSRHGAPVRSTHTIASTIRR
jgi:hypothetical protein